MYGDEGLPRHGLIQLDFVLYDQSVRLIDVVISCHCQCANLQHVRSELLTLSACFVAQENTSIYEPGYHRAITWKDFKEKDKDCKDWDFGESDPYRRDFEGKAQKAWKKVGRRFCKRFGTKFTEYGEQSTSTPRSRHYLLILDSSGSMAGGKWTAVVEAMRQMARSESELALKSKFSVILFSDFAHMAISNCAASEILEARFDPLFSGARFADAFRCAAGFVRATDFADLRPMVVFMTDGQDGSKSSQRNTAIYDLMGCFNAKQQPWDFRAIAFGSDAGSGLLQEIADTQVGCAAKSSKYIEASTEMDLVQVPALLILAFALIRRMNLFNVQYLSISFLEYRWHQC